MQQIPVQSLVPSREALGERPQLLDVREPWEVQIAPLTVDGFETVHIPMGQIPARCDELDSDRAVVCMCHHGMRSLQVAAYLERRGFPAVFNLHGGIDAWSNQVDPRVPRY